MPNRLANESSPYLRQHADNPVDWYAWGDEALAAARDTGKPIFLSIGYSSCHWCHVMAHESFENPEIARYLNEHFVSIKVDREERPDLDAIYMIAVQLLTGHGGWPLSVFLTPEGDPFYGGTYFPPADRIVGVDSVMPGFPRVLEAVVDAYGGRGDEVAQAAEEVKAHLERHFTTEHTRSVLTTGVLDEALRNLEIQYEPINGGFGGAPKFPPSMVIEFLFRSWKRTGREQPLKMASYTLASMAHGGIYDQVGGGFHRYSVDSVWLVPHFEKMLYDNALLSRDYALAWQITGEELFRRVAAQTYDYVLRELTSPGGGFYSAQDADSEGVEGKFYVWSLDELTETVGADVPVVARFFGATDNGNFEGKNILTEAVSPQQVAEEFGISLERFTEIIEQARRALYERRGTRVWPGRDDKVLTAWNALMLRSLAEGGVILERPDLIEAARRNARFIRESLVAGGRLLHVWTDGTAKVGAFLEDHANLLNALVSLYEATFEVEWIAWARRLAATMIAEFWDEERGGFYDTAVTDQPLIVRPKEVFDSATPSGNAEAGEALLRLSVLLADDELRQRASAVLEQYGALASRQPTGFGRLLTAYDLALAPTREVVLAGDPDKPETQALLRTIRRPYLPWKVVALRRPDATAADERVVPLLAGRGEIDGRPAAFVCEQYACRLPVTTPEALAGELGIDAPAGT